MIPTPPEAKKLWETYHLPEVKRNHCAWVSRLALWFASRLKEQNPSVHINRALLEAAALLHDIDKNIPREPFEHHPDTAVRVLRERDYDEVADVVRTHPLHAILDQTISPKTWEERLLFLSDKMVKHSVITVDERFALWRAEQLPASAVSQLDTSYPKVKLLENEVCSLLGLQPSDIVKKVASDRETSTMENDA